MALIGILRQCTRTSRARGDAGRVADARATVRRTCQARVRLRQLSQPCRSRQQAQRCANCHKDVADDLREHRGFHGRRPEIAGAQCSACHSDHMGRTGRITPVLPATFDHLQTDFRLDGAHRGVACAGCHAAGKKFRDAPGKCVDCHRKVEPHEGKLGTDCAACHDTSRWSATRFDHSKTKFPLQASHAQIPCASCHAGNRWKATPTACASCHTPDDVHRGQRGTDCASCHTQDSWTDAQVRSRKGNRLRAAGRTPAGSLSVLPSQRATSRTSCRANAWAVMPLRTRTPAAWAASARHAMSPRCWKTTHFDHGATPSTP